MKAPSLSPSTLLVAAGAGVLLLIVVVFLVGKAVPLFSGAPDAVRSPAAQIEDRIRPVARVRVADPAQAAAEAAAAPVAAGGAADVARGETVYKQACFACHDTGAAGAPKRGDAAAWGVRAEQGYEVLVEHAVKGFNAMPAKGGNAALADADVAAAVAYLLTEAGLDAPAGAAVPSADAVPAEPAPADSAATEPAATAPAVALDLARGEAVYKQACLACHDTGAAGAPKRGDTAAWEPRAAQGTQVLVQHALQGFNAMPAKGGNSALADADVVAAVGYLLHEAGLPGPAGAAAEAAPAAAPSAAVEPAHEPAPETAASAEPAPEPAAMPEPVVEAPAPAVVAAPAPAVASAPAIDVVEVLETDLAGVDMARGRQLYRTACVICHQTGINNAPRLGDAEAWASRAAKGLDALVENAINGYKAMPARGGLMNISDEELRSAVGYMLTNSR